jgi:methionyl-tRNA formyltransferase
MKKKAGSFVDIEKPDAIFIQCNPGILEIREVKLEGKRRMSVGEFLRGHKIPRDTIFGPMG